jgi:hypothetical protein
MTTNSAQATPSIPQPERQGVVLMGVLAGPDRYAHPAGPLPQPEGGVGREALAKKLHAARVADDTEAAELSELSPRLIARWLAVADAAIKSLARPSTPEDSNPPQGATMKVTDEMVSRFLCWRLPDDFAPDAGITFKRVYNESSPMGPSVHEPVGTNLLTAPQARAMLEHVLSGSVHPAEAPNEGRDIRTAGDSLGDRLTDECRDLYYGNYWPDTNEDTSVYGIWCASWAAARRVLSPDKGAGK